MILPVLQWPDERLRRAATLVDGPDGLMRIGQAGLVGDLIHTMRASKGAIGLAAPQVGVQARVFVMERSRSQFDAPRPPWVVINPEVLEQSARETTWEEECLSCPGMSVAVRRPKWITARWRSETWERWQLRLSHMEARCFLHELDHLNGVTLAESGWECGVCGRRFQGDYCPTCKPR